MATTIFTDYGQQLITEAIANKTTINITKIAVGDGMGAIYTPVSTQTALKRETWSGPIDSVQVNPTNKNQVIFEGIVGANVGGFYIREIGLYDQANKLVAISDFPESFKALADQYELYVRMILQTGSADVTNIIVSKDMIYATKKYVDTETAKKYSKPTNGIPKTDLTAAVQTSLEKADNAAPTTELAKTNQALTTHQADNVSHDTYVTCATSSATAEKVVTATDFTLVEGARITVKFANANTATTPTLKINTEVAKPIVKADGTAFKNIKAGVYSFVYSGLNFTVQGEGGEYGTATASDVLKGKTFGTENGLIEGVATIANLGGVSYASGTVVSGRKSGFLNHSAQAIPDALNYIDIDFSILNFIPDVVVISRNTGTINSVHNTVWTKKPFLDALNGNFRWWANVMYLTTMIQAPYVNGVVSIPCYNNTNDVAQFTWYAYGLEVKK